MREHDAFRGSGADGAFGVDEGDQIYFGIIEARK